MCVVVLHTGTVPPHCAFDVHGTHVPLGVKQTGVAPPHCERLVAEHWPQRPVGWQAGVVPPHSPSPAQARQVCVTVLQTGVTPLHCALVRHGTHVAVGVWHTGVAPLHRVAFVAEHCWHDPFD